MRSTFDLETSLRRIRPAKWRAPVRRRDKLNFVSEGAADIGPVMLDTCVYLDAGKGKLPPATRRLISKSHLFHCSVCIAEIAYTFGRLDPTHPDTAATLNFMRNALSRVRVYRTLTPDRNAFVEAGIITGTLARTQGLGPPERSKLMSDVLIFLTARHVGYPVLTANANDFDLIQQLAPDGKVIYYNPL